MWRAAGRIVAIVMLGGFLSATLVRFAPGFEAREEQLDPRRGEASLRQLQDARAPERNPLAFYARFVAGYFTGDLGVSRLLGRPVLDLFAERAPLTARAVGLGLLGTWLAALAGALAAVRYRRAGLEAGMHASSLLLQCLPAAVLGLLILASGMRGIAAGATAIGLVLYPRLLLYILNLVGEGEELPHVLTARAKGLGPWRVLTHHVLPVAFPRLLALAGVSISMAVSAAIPIEVILDLPGVGQLAWQAALGRDMTLLVNITVLLCAIITAANALTDWRGSRVS